MRSTSAARQRCLVVFCRSSTSRLTLCLAAVNRLLRWADVPACAPRSVACLVLSPPSDIYLAHFNNVVLHGSFRIPLPFGLKGAEDEGKVALEVTSIFIGEPCVLAFEQVIQDVTSQWR